MLERHPFSGQIHSAGELLQTPYADFYFHDHRPAVKMSQRLLWFLE